MRLAGFITFGSNDRVDLETSLVCTGFVPIPGSLRLIGVASNLLGISWLIRMFLSLGSNLTDTLVTGGTLLSSTTDRTAASGWLWEPGWCRLLPPLCS
jgi:hypothetical protein